MDRKLSSRIGSGKVSLCVLMYKVKMFSENLRSIQINIFPVYLDFENTCYTKIGLGIIYRFDINSR